MALSRRLDGLAPVPHEASSSLECAKEDNDIASKTKGSRALQRRSRRASLIVSKGSGGPVEAAAILLSIIRRVDAAVPGTKEELVKNIGSSTGGDSALLEQLANLRASSSLQQRRRLDESVVRSGVKSRIVASRSKYILTRKAWGRARSVVRGVPESRLSKVGRKPKLGAALMARARAILMQNSQASSRVAVLKRGRKTKDPSSHGARVPARTLMKTPAQILRDHPSLGIGPTSFRRLLRSSLLEFRKPTRLTDMCTHCVQYQKKIIPRYSAFWNQARKNIERFCPSYFLSSWDRAPNVKAAINCVDTLKLVDGLLLYLGRHSVRAAAIRPTGDALIQLQAEEKSVIIDLKLHRRVIESYDWHIVAAQRVRDAVRDVRTDLPRGVVHYQGDFMENVNLPRANVETSDMFYGQARKTVGVYTAYILQWIDNKVEELFIIVVAEVVDKTATWANHMVNETLKFIRNPSGCACLEFHFDTGTHFRSSESLHYYLVDLPVRYGVKVRLSYWVEKHGKDKCDSIANSSCDRWLESFLKTRDATVFSAQKLAEVYTDGAKQQMRDHPHGPRFEADDSINPCLPSLV